MIGVTGLPCAGKSLAAELISSGEIDGIRRVLLKADDIGHEILNRPAVRHTLRERFGEAIDIAAAPEALRRAVAEQVFADPAALEWLERLVHPLVTEEAVRRTGEAEEPVVIEAALLSSAGLDRLCGAVILVGADAGTRLARAAQRGWDANELRRREKRLLPLFGKMNATNSETNLVRVDNSGSVGELRKQLRDGLETLPRTALQ